MAGSHWLPIIHIYPIKDCALAIMVTPSFFALFLLLHLYCRRWYSLTLNRIKSVRADGRVLAHSPKQFLLWFIICAFHFLSVSISLPPFFTFVWCSVQSMGILRCVQYDFTSCITHQRRFQCLVVGLYLFDGKNRVDGNIWSNFEYSVFEKCSELWNQL